MFFVPGGFGVIDLPFLDVGALFVPLSESFLMIYGSCTAYELFTVFLAPRDLRLFAPSRLSAGEFSRFSFG